MTYSGDVAVGLLIVIGILDPCQTFQANAVAAAVHLFIMHFNDRISQIFCLDRSAQVIYLL